MSAPGNVQKVPNSRDNWRTPDDVYAALNWEFGFFLDAAASKENHKTPKYHRGPCTGEEYTCICGLHAAWIGPVFLNPPYGDGLAAWMVKCNVEANQGQTVVALVPCSVEAQWYKEAMETCDEERRLVRRIQFIDPDTGKVGGSNTRGSTVFVWRPYPDTRKAPPRTFYWDWRPARA
jgi:phage N-6-adenine-methyltransferase